MTPEAPRLAVDLPVEQEPASDLPQRLGRGLLATAGVTLALAVGGTPIAAAETPSDQPDQPSWFQPDETGLEPLPMSVDPGPFQFGVTVYSWNTEDTPAPHALFRNMKAASMTGARVNLSRENSTYDQSVIEHEEVSADTNGQELVVNLVQSPKTSLRGFPEWAADRAKKLPGIRRFIAFNEVNNPDPNVFWAHSMKTYVNILHKTYDAIHEVRPDAVVSGFGLDSIHNPIAYLKRAAHYANKKFGGLHKIMDTLSLHLYKKKLSGDQEIVTQAESIWDGPINIDEAGVNVRQPNQRKVHPHGTMSEGTVSRTKQAKLLPRLIKWAASNFQVKNVYNYHLVNNTDPSDLKTGLMTPGGVKLPAYHTSKAAADEVTTGGLSP